MSSLTRTESVDPKKMKRAVMDKQPPANCRDYLDMDTDEEEFGRQETPEPDEDLPAEPEKPVFTDDEMETLVSYVKNLTILPSAEEYTWPVETIEVIQVYFHCPANIILTIFFEATECKALLGFPFQAERGLTYFVRSPGQVYSPKNFLSSVTFGSISEDMEMSVLKFLENMYSPLAVHSKEWPRVTKDEVLSNLNQFLMKLTDVTYGPMGLTILYIPREGILSKKSDELIPLSKKDDKGYIERLERIARYWIKQIRGALRGSDLPPRPSCGTIMEEIAFWNYRFENLSCLQHQLSSKSVLGVIQILEQVNSSSIQQFHHLSNKVNMLGSEASSNVIYLNLFIDSCIDFKVPDGIDDYSSKILYLIRFVGLESKHYTSIDNINVLCRALGTQIIEQCKKYINLNVILEGDTSEGKVMLKNSINCCHNFFKTFDRISQMDALSKKSVISKIDRNAYCHVDIFIQRCEDLTEISDARFVYNNCEEVKMIGGARGSVHEAQYKKIEKSFTVILEEVKKMRDAILDVTTNVWLNRIVGITSQIRDIDNMVNNLIQEIFKDVQNVEEGIEALYAMKRFVTRKHLQKTLQSYWTVVWKIFETELDNTNFKTLNNVYDTAMTPHAGCATILRLKAEYLMNQLNMLIDASDWFGDTNIQDQIMHKYKRIQAALAEHEASLFANWEKGVQADTEIVRLLSEPVIKFLPSPNESFLTVNIDPSYITNMKAVIEWKYLKYDSKIMSSKFLQKLQPIRARYVRISCLCDLYNSVIKLLSEKERLLLENAINEVKNVVIAALPKCTWSTEDVDKIYAEWLRNILILRDLVIAFKLIDSSIDISCEKLANAVLIETTTNSFYALNEFKDYMDTKRSEKLIKMKESSKSILSDLYALHRKAKHGEVTPRNWTIYVADVINKFKASFIKNIRASLKSALKFFHKDQFNDSAVLFNVNVSLSDEYLIIFTPEISEIRKALQRLIPITSKEIYDIEEFSRVLKFAVGRRDDEDFIDTNDSVNELKARIEEIVNRVLSGIEKFKGAMTIGEDLTQIHGILNTSSPQGNEKTKEILENAICRCEETLDLANTLEDSIEIHFITLNTENFKSRLFEECENLKDTLFVELSKFIASELTLERMPAQINEMI